MSYQSDDGALTLCVCLHADFFNIMGYMLFPFNTQGKSWKQVNVKCILSNEYFDFVTAEYTIHELW